MSKHHEHDISRRDVVTGGAVVAGGAVASVIAASANAEEATGLAAYADPAEPALPDTDCNVTLADTALVITDPQIGFLHPDGVTWGVVGESVTEHGTVENLERLLVAAKARDMGVFISPHHYYPTDHGWKFEGPLEKLMHKIGMFDRKGPYTTEGFENSGADFMPQYKP
ncbi:MAG: isochorismatase family protein, partial [Geminicoccaceae bacterium]